MATIKTAYTMEQTVALVEAYKASPTVDTVNAFAESFGKSVKSIVAKLSREGVYQKKAYVTKAGIAPVKKDSLADVIGSACNLSDAETDSLAKANKTALVKIANVLKLEAAE